MPNFCMCGAENSYPHAPKCPYPYYGSDMGREVDWQQHHALLVLGWKFVPDGKGGTFFVDPVLEKLHTLPQALDAIGNYWEKVGPNDH